MVLAAGALGGAGWAAITALLRDRFNANEILVSLMLVYVAQLLLGYLVFGPWKDPQGFNFPQTRSFDAAAMLPLLVPQSRLHVGALLALVLVALTWAVMFRTFAGFALQVGGLAPPAARYAGFSERRGLWSVMLLSGGFAGLAGAMEAAGPLGQLTPHVSTGYGFTAIIVAFVGAAAPARLRALGRAVVDVRHRLALAVQARSALGAHRRVPGAAAVLAAGLRHPRAPPPAVSGRLIAWTSPRC